MQTGNSQSNIYTRPHGHIDLEKLGVPSFRIGEIAGMVVGKNGSGIRRYTSTVSGAFVKLQTTKELSASGESRPDLSRCRYVYISARTIQDVQKVALMVNQDIIHYFRGISVQPSRPTLNVNAPLQREVVGFVIGCNGDNLKRIQRYVGEECFIVHDSTSNIFRVTANTTNACRLAECKITDSIREFMQRTKKPQNPPPSNQHNSNTTGSRYECIGEQSYNEDDDSASVTSSLIDQHSTSHSHDEELTKPSKKARKKNRRAKQLENQLFDNSSVSSNGSIANIRSVEQEKKRVRDNLSKTTDENGNLYYPDVDFWDNKSRRWVKLSGSAAVPWEDVEQELRSRSQSQIHNSANTTPVWQPDTDIANPVATPHVAKGCWSSPSSNLWDSNGVDEVNAAEFNRRVNKTTPTSRAQSYTTESSEIQLDLELLQLEEYYGAHIDLTEYYSTQPYSDTYPDTYQY